MKTKTKKQQEKQVPQFNNIKGTCFRCKGKILPNSNYLKLITINNNKVIEEIWFHLVPPCWGEYNSEKVNQRIKEMAAIGLKSIQPLLERMQ